MQWTIHHFLYSAFRNAAVPGQEDMMIAMGEDGWKEAHQKGKNWGEKFGGREQGMPAILYP